MKRPYILAAVVVAVEVVATAAILRAPFLVVLAVPWLVGVGLARRHPRTSAVVVALAGVLVVALAVPNLLHSETWKDVQFDVVAGGAALVALADAVRSLMLGGNRVTGLADR